MDFYVVATSDLQQFSSAIPIDGEIHTIPDNIYVGSAVT